MFPCTANLRSVNAIQRFLYGTAFDRFDNWQPPIRITVPSDKTSTSVFTVVYIYIGSFLANCCKKNKFPLMRLLDKWQRTQSEKTTLPICN